MDSSDHHDNSIIPDEDAPLEASARLQSERDALASELERLTHERDALVQERNQLGELRYRFEHERDVARAEIDQLRNALQHSKAREISVENGPVLTSRGDLPEITIFLHVAKTAGVTLGNVLNRQFDMDKILTADAGSDESALGVWSTAPFERRFRELSDERRNAIEYVAGHFMFGVHRMFERTVKYITLLRHPVDRVVSSFYYILSRPEIPVHATIIDNKMSLDDYIDSGLGLDPHNYQTRILSGLPELDSSWSQTRSHVHVPKSALEAAKANIASRCLLAGITERFDEFLLVMKLMYGWPLVRILYTSENLTPVRPAVREVSPKTIARIEDANQLDLALYEFASQRFATTVECHEAALTYLRPRFSALNKLQSLSVAEPHATASRRALEVLCDIADAGIPVASPA